MNIIRMAIAPAVLAATMAFTACSDKTTPIIIEQSQRINTDLQTLVQENPELIAKAEAQYAEDRINVDVALADSLFKVGLITDPLFNYFTACEIKDHADKNLEILVNALTEKEMPIVVNLTDAYGDAKSYELSPATLRRMVKSPLTQLDYNETRDALFAALAASADQFMPDERTVKEITTSFKGGFYAYNVVFDNPRSYRGLVTANLKADRKSVV